MAVSKIDPTWGFTRFVIRNMLEGQQLRDRFCSEIVYSQSAFAFRLGFLRSNRLLFSPSQRICQGGGIDHLKCCRASEASSERHADKIFWRDNLKF